MTLLLFFGNHLWQSFIFRNKFFHHAGLLHPLSLLISKISFCPLKLSDDRNFCLFAFSFLFFLFTSIHKSFSDVNDYIKVHNKSWLGDKHVGLGLQIILFDKISISETQIRSFIIKIYRNLKRSKCLKILMIL